MDRTTRDIQHLLTVQAVDCELFSVRWSLDGLMIAAGAADGNVIVYSSQGELIGSLPCYGALPCPVTSVRWRPMLTKTKNVLVASTCEGSLYHYHITSKKIIHFSQNRMGIMALDYSPDGSYYAIGCDDSTVQLFDENTKSVLRVFNEDSGVHHCAKVMCVKWNTPQTFWTGGWDKNLIMWDTRSAKSIKHINNIKLCGESLDFSGHTLITGEYEVQNQVKIWDIRSLQCIQQQTIGEPGDKCLIYSLQHHSDIIGVSGTGKNNLYFLSPSLEVQGFVAGIEKPVYSLDFCQSNNKVAVCSGDGTIRVFTL